MGMSISEAIETLLYTNAYGTADIAKRVAVNIMRKYQKIEEAYKKYQNESVTNIYADGKFIKALKEVLEDGSNDC